jgi:hypothetical protein
MSILINIFIKVSSQRFGGRVAVLDDLFYGIEGVYNF